MGRIPVAERMTAAMVETYFGTLMSEAVRHPETIRTFLRATGQVCKDAVGRQLTEDEILAGLSEATSSMKLTANRDKAVLLPMLAGLRMAPLLMQQEWVFHEATGDDFFITSDNPVILAGPMGSQHWILCPLGRQLCLEIRGDAQGGYRRLKADTEFVLTVINTLSIINADERVLSPRPSRWLADQVQALKNQRLEPHPVLLHEMQQQARMSFHSMSQTNEA